MNRKVDELGRIVIPIEIRNKLKIQEGSVLEIQELGGRIMLKRIEVGHCKECGSALFSMDKYCSNCGKKVPVWKVK